MDEQIRELIAEIRSMRDQLIRMDERMNKVSDHEDRLRTLERARWPLPSLAVIISVAGFLLAAIRTFGGST